MVKTLVLVLMVGWLVLLTGCEKQDISDQSIWVICDQYQDICDATHSGALCTIPRSETIRALATHRDNLTSINAYEALTTLDRYKSCLEDAYVSESVRRKKDKQSQMNTIRGIPELQKQIITDTNSLIRPEINLWLWKRSQSSDYLESMINGAELAKDVHIDVYVALMMQSAQSDPEKARMYARKALKKASLIADIQPRIYEFYVGYYLDKGDLLKAAIWQGLYSAKDNEQASINARYFKLHEKMSSHQINKAQREVDDLLFDARWLNKDMSAFPKKLI